MNEESHSEALKCQSCATYGMYYLAEYEYGILFVEHD